MAASSGAARSGLDQIGPNDTQPPSLTAEHPRMAPDAPTSPPPADEMRILRAQLLVAALQRLEVTLGLLRIAARMGEILRVLGARPS
jgi:hypothetical protein